MVPISRKKLVRNLMSSLLASLNETGYISLSLATGWGDLGSIASRDSDFFCHSFRLALGPVPRPKPNVKLPGRDTDHSFTSAAKVRR